MDIESRIEKLNSKMKEYIEYGRKIGIITDSNIERVVTRLERVKIEVDNNLKGGDGFATPDREKGIINLKINKEFIENEMKKDEKKYYEDEVYFHEFTHAVNGIYEGWIEKGDAFKFKKNYLNEVKKDNYQDDYNLITDSMTDKEKSDFNKYVNNKDLKLAGYGWGLLDEFVAQTMTQKLIKNKYNNEKIYKVKHQVSNISEPEYDFYSDLADYEVFTPFAYKFAEALYGRKDIDKLCSDVLEENFIENTIKEFKKRPNGLEDLYKMLGYMGNIYVADAIKKGHMDKEKIKQRDPEGFTKDGKNINKSINKFMTIADKQIAEKQKSDVKKSSSDKKNEDSKQNEDASDKRNDKKDNKNNENKDEYSVKISEKQKELYALIKEMTKSYINRDHSKDLENHKKYSELIKSIVDLKIQKSNKNITNIDKMMEIRRLDASASSIVFMLRSQLSNEKNAIDTKRSESDLKYAINNFEKMLKSDIELQSELHVGIDDEKDNTKNKDIKNNDNKDVKNKENKDNSSESKSDDNNTTKSDNKKDAEKEENNIGAEEENEKVDVIYSAEKNQYIIKITQKDGVETEVRPAKIFKSKNEKEEFINEIFIDEDDKKYVFGDNYEKALKKCDIQLIDILSDIDMDYAREYIDCVLNKKKKEFQHSIVYDLSKIQENKKMSLFDKIRIKLLARKNNKYAKVLTKANIDEIEENELRAIESGDNKTSEEQYREEMAVAKTNETAITNINTNTSITKTNVSTENREI